MINSKIIDEATISDKKEFKILKSFINLLYMLKIIKKNKFNRVLPLGDYFVDRYEKADFLGFGEGSSIYDSSYVFGDVTVGNNCWIGPFTLLDGTGKLIIGNNVIIGAGAKIFTHHGSNTLSANAVHFEKSAVIIGDNTYIGPNVFISKGVTIGENVYIEPNCSIYNDVPSNSKVIGYQVQLENL